MPTVVALFLVTLTLAYSGMDISQSTEIINTILFWKKFTTSMGFKREKKHSHLSYIPSQGWLDYYRGGIWQSWTQVELKSSWRVKMSVSHFVWALPLLKCMKCVIDGNYYLIKILKCLRSRSFNQLLLLILWLSTWNGWANLCARRVIGRTTKTPASRNISLWCQYKYGEEREIYIKWHIVIETQ